MIGSNDMDDRAPLSQVRPPVATVPALLASQEVLQARSRRRRNQRDNHCRDNSNYNYNYDYNYTTGNTPVELVGGGQQPPSAAAHAPTRMRMILQSPFEDRTISTHAVEEEDEASRSVKKYRR
uniref:Uncharacterized protein n=1 Tax=Cyclophora tenuis TaxID=216820 RepID=A0A7S1CYD8_CYCTE